MTCIACSISSLTTSRMLKSWGLREEFLIYPVNDDLMPISERPLLVDLQNLLENSPFATSPNQLITFSASQWPRSPWDAMVGGAHLPPPQCSDVLVALWPECSMNLDQSLFHIHQPSLRDTEAGVKREFHLSIIVG
jgi:hypothetical protein